MKNRPVKIYLGIKEEYLEKSIKKFLSLLTDKEHSNEIISNTDEADLIIFTDLRSIVYNEEKFYIFISFSAGFPLKPSLPENCVFIGRVDFMGEVIKVIGKVRNSLSEEEPIIEEPKIPIRADAKRILVIDDKPRHVLSARRCLVSHRLTISSDYDKAMDILAKEKFDVVLTDLHLPMSPKKMGNNFRFGQMVAYGFLLMLEAARQGAKYVAVVTDVSHHDDPFSATFDHYSQFSFKIKNAKVMMIHAQINQNGGKDWGVALHTLIKD